MPATLQTYWKRYEAGEVVKCKCRYGTFTTPLPGTSLWVCPEPKIKFRDPPIGTVYQCRHCERRYCGFTMPANAGNEPPVVE